MFLIRSPHSRSGFILVLTIIMIVILTLVAVQVLSLGAHQKRLADAVSGKRMVAHYRSQAGLVDAQWRIRENVTALHPTGSLNSSSPSQDFADPAWNPPVYYIDLDSDTTSLVRRSSGVNIDDVQVDIGAMTGGSRAIDSVGYDSNS
jgi:Tfp pilus assembly protein PilX